MHSSSSAAVGGLAGTGVDGWSERVVPPARAVLRAARGATIHVIASAVSARIVITSDHAWCNQAACRLRVNIMLLLPYVGGRVHMGSGRDRGWQPVGVQACVS